MDTALRKSHADDRWRFLIIAQGTRPLLELTNVLLLPGLHTRSLRLFAASDLVACDPVFGVCIVFGTTAIR